MNRLFALLWCVALLACDGAGAPTDPFAPLDDPAAPTGMAGHVLSRPGVTCCGEVTVLFPDGARLRRQWSPDGAFDFEELSSGRATVVLNDGEGYGAVLEVVLQPRGRNDLGEIELVPLTELPQLLSMRGIGFEERLTRGNGDLSSAVISSDGAFVYAVRGGGTIVRIDSETGDERVIEGELFPGGMIQPALRLLSDRYLMLTDASAAAQRSGFIYDLAVRDQDSTRSGPVEYQRRVTSPGQGNFHTLAWVEGETLYVVGRTSSSSPDRHWLSLGRYDGSSRYPVWSQQLGPYSFVGVVGRTDSGQLLRVEEDSSSLLLLANQITGGLDVLVNPAPASGLFLIQQELWAFDPNTAVLEAFELPSGTRARAPIDLGGLIPPMTSNRYFLPAVAALDPVHARLALVIEAEPINFGASGITAVHEVDLLTGAPRQLPLTFTEAGRTFSSEPEASGEGLELFRWPTAEYSPAGRLRLKFATNSSFRRDVAVIDSDGTGTRGRFFAATDTEWKHEFVLFDVPQRALEVRVKRDPTSDYLGVWTAPAGSADSGFRRRTFIAADHTNLLVAPSGEFLLYLMRDPIGGQVQLFRIAL